MGRLVTKPFHSDDVTKVTNRPIRAALEKSHVVGSRKGMSRSHARDGDCRQSTTPFFFQTTTWFIPNFSKKGLQAGTVVL